MNKIYKILPSFFLLISLLFISCEAEKEKEISVTSPESISEPSSSAPSEEPYIKKSTTRDRTDEFALEEEIVAVPEREETVEAPSEVGSPTEEEMDELDVTVTAEEREETGGAASGVSYPAEEEEMDEFLLEEPIVTTGEREETVEAPSEVGYPAEEGTDEFTLEEFAVTAEEHELADLYKVELGADEIIKMPGIPGELRVWIGRPDYGPNFRDSMVTAEDTLPAVGVTALITPFAPAFEVEPKESVCMKIHPTGSEVRFTLKPTQKGIFSVGADVYLYESDDCTGPAIPKATTALRVEVKVDHVSVIMLHIKKLWEVFWEKLLDFYGAVIALFFALLLFLIRGRLKKWFGYS